MFLKIFNLTDGFTKTYSWYLPEPKISKAKKNNE